jgi:hypothetical protein
MPQRIGLLVGSDRTLAEAVIARCVAEPEIECELARLGGTPERLVCRYDVLIDRISHQIPHYRAFLRVAALGGTLVLDDPFWASAVDRFFALSLAARLGIPTPRAVLLPQKAYGSGLDPDRSLGNLEFPLRWREISDYVRFPAVLEPVLPGSALSPATVNDQQSLWTAFDATGTEHTLLREHVDGTQRVRCIGIGPDSVLTVEVDLRSGLVLGHDDESWLAAPLRERLGRYTLQLNAALGLHVASTDFVVLGGVPRLVEPSDPAVELGLSGLPARVFAQVVDALTDLAVRCAWAGRSPAPIVPWTAASRAAAG